MDRQLSVAMPVMPAVHTVRKQVLAENFCPESIYNLKLASTETLKESVGLFFVLFMVGRVSGMRCGTGGAAAGDGTRSQAMPLPQAAGQVHRF